MFALCPQDVGIILTYRCRSACKHCIYNCGPRWERASMSREDVRTALQTISVWPQMPQVHFTGGEPFLDFSLLLEAVGMASELGIPCYLETSASWCVDDELSVARFLALHESGLQAVLVSCSPFHAEQIPLARTKRAIRCALEVFGHRGVMVYMPEYLDRLAGFETERVVPLRAYDRQLGSRMLWREYGLIGGGRAGYELGYLTAKRPARAFEGASCANEILYAVHSHFDLYGNFISGFCGGLAVGDWHDLPQVLAAFQGGCYPELVDVLVERGPHGLLDLAQETGYESLPGGYADKCHLCVDVRRWLVEAGVYPELRPLGFYEQV